MSSMVPSQDPSLQPSRASSSFGSFGALWRDPATSSKLMALALLVASLAAGGYGAFLLVRGSERLLYRDLPEREAALAVERLASAGLTARLGDDGRSVWVTGDIESARMLLAKDGLPASGLSGFELFDDTGFGMTDFLEQVNYRRALEGELSRTISALDEVANARVHLVLPKDSAFAGESEPAKASVSLRLHRSMTKASVDAVVHVVASAVSGLTPEKVAVVDSHGRVLHGGNGDSSGSGLTDEQLALKSKIERELTEKALAILVPLVGESGVRVRTTVDMDFDRSEETLESYDPEGSVVRSRRVEEHTRLPDSVGIARGIPGTRSNPPEDGGGGPADGSHAADGAGGDAASDAPPPEPRLASTPVTTRTSEIVNYEVTKRVRHVSTPTGKLTRRSVAVVVDDVSSGDGSDAATKSPRSEEDMAKFEALVVAALGLDLDAGDTVTVENIAFEPQPAPLEVPEPTTWEQVKPYLAPVGRNAGLVALLLGFYLLLFRPVMRKLAEPLPREAGVLPEVRQGSLGAGDALGALPASRGLESGVIERAQQVSQQSPEVASELVRGWLSEDG